MANRNLSVDGDVNARSSRELRRGRLSSSTRPFRRPPRHGMGRVFELFFRESGGVEGERYCMLPNLVAAVSGVGKRTVRSWELNRLDSIFEKKEKRLNFSVYST